MSKIEYRTYQNLHASAPPSKMFFTLPHFMVDGEPTMTFFTYGPTEEESEAKAKAFWEAELAKAQANRSNRGVGVGQKGGRPQNTLITPAILAKLDNFDPKG